MPDVATSSGRHSFFGRISLKKRDRTREEANPGGAIAEQAVSVVDSRDMAERLADLRRDAAVSWQDPAHLRALDATMVGELRYEGERKDRDAGADGIDTAIGVQLDPASANRRQGAITSQMTRTIVRACAENSAWPTKSRGNSPTTRSSSLAARQASTGQM